MQFSPSMISLVQEIRRRAPAEVKPRLRFGNPHLVEELLPFYDSCDDVVTKALIKELFAQGDGEWQNWHLNGVAHYRGNDRLASADSGKAITAPTKKPSTTAKKGPSVRTYRGQTYSVASDDSSSETVKTSPEKPKRMYRGQPIR